MSTVHPLGKNQRAVIKALRERHGFWRAGCGWHWSTNRATERLLESLRARGLVSFEVETVTRPSLVRGSAVEWRAYPAKTWRLTDAGWKVDAERRAS